MYLKKVEGPRTVTLPDGSHMSRSDLPSPKTKRWVASRKATVVLAVNCGLLEREEAFEMYGISEEEFLSWEDAVRSHGVQALRTTRLQKYRGNSTSI